MAALYRELTVLRRFGNLKICYPGLTRKIEKIRFFVTPTLHQTSTVLTDRTGLTERLVWPKSPTEVLVGWILLPTRKIRHPQIIIRVTISVETHNFGKGVGSYFYVINIPIILASFTDLVALIWVCTRSRGTALQLRTRSAILARPAY
jgi:hypothetical protein